MQVLNVKKDKGSVTAVIRIDDKEFASSLRRAYLDNTDRFPVPGCAPGLAPRSEIEKIYGENALFDEALADAVPAAFKNFLAKQQIRVIGKPEVIEISRLDDGCVDFCVKSALYPAVKLGKYKGLKVSPRRGDSEEDFTMAVLKEACKNMQGEVSDIMLEQKLDALAAQEKLRVSQDSVYHLLADVLFVLNEAYHATGVSRSAAQVRAEAMDVMLQTVTGENKNPSKEFISQQIRRLAEQYRTLPEDFDAKLDKIFQTRVENKNKMSPEELASEAFKAYLGSLGMDEDKWRAERRDEAAESARCDLLLGAVAEAENITVTDGDIRDFVSKIAEQCEMDVDDVISQIDLEPLKHQILRDKACKLIKDSAAGGVKQ